LRARCRDDHEVDDLVQDTLLRAARYRPSLADPERLRGWTLSIAGNVLRDHMRREGRWSRTESEDSPLEELVGRDEPPGHGEDPVWTLAPDTAVGQETVLRHLEAAVGELGARDRCLLVAYYGGEGGCTDAGSACGIAPELVKVRLFRARRRLERALRRSLATLPLARRGA
jgi:RNA polymerase sigma-70 factor (ECF subfamily)